MMGTVGEIDVVLKGAGIPIIGVVLRRIGPPVDAYVQYAPEATAAQKRKGELIFREFDWGAGPPTASIVVQPESKRRVRKLSTKLQSKKTRRKNHE